MRSTTTWQAASFSPTRPTPPASRQSRSRSRHLYGHSSHDTQKGRSQKCIQTSIIKATARRNSERRCSNRNHPPSKRFAAPEVWHLPPREPPPGDDYDCLYSFNSTLVQPIPLGVRFSDSVSKLKALSLNLSFATFQ